VAIVQSGLIIIFYRGTGTNKKITQKSRFNVVAPRFDIFLYSFGIFADTGEVIHIDFAGKTFESLCKLPEIAFQDHRYMVDWTGSFYCPQCLMI